MKIISPTPHLNIGYSLRSEGSFRTQPEVLEYLHRTVPDVTWAYLKLEHGTQRLHVRSRDIDEPYVGDAIVTKTPGIGLTMVVGDCFPIVLFDPKTMTIAMIHGGWRSLLQNIIDLTVKELQHFDYHCSVQNLTAWIGPGLRKDSNVLQDEPLQFTFPQWETYVQHARKGYSIDLVQFITDRLLANQVTPDHIFDSGIDTYADPNHFFSHRRSVMAGDDDGRFIVAVWTTP